jgi:hypothetical protein
MTSPLVAHTFDFVRVYLSMRDLAPPGSGTWSDPVIIFDGTQEYLTYDKLSTFSAGGLLPSDVFGIVGQSGNASQFAFVGNGRPAAPQNITYPGITGSGILPADYWNTSQGAVTYAGVTYLPVIDGNLNQLKVLKWTTGGASSATEADASHAPAGDTSFGAIQRVDNYFYFFVPSDDTDNNWACYSFNMATGLYEAPFAFLTGANIKAFSDQSPFTNGLFVFLNGDLGIFYNNESRDPVYLLWTKTTSTWSNEISLPGAAYANSVIDPNLEVIHCLTYATHNATEVNSQVTWSTVTHNGTVTTISTIPATVSPSLADGVGHPSIQGGMLFVPRDDKADFDNSVWVAFLSGGSFSKEALPVPAGETNAYGGSLLSGGTGYANGDTGLIDNGGTVVNPLIYQITGNSGGVVTNFNTVNLGGGYSLGAATTSKGGTQPGSGSGFTVDVQSLSPKAPSCAYMMYPNGYSLLPPVVTLDFNVHSGMPLPSAALLASNPSGVIPPGPPSDPSECVYQQ